MIFSECARKARAKQEKTLVMRVLFVLGLAPFAAAQTSLLGDICPLVGNSFISRMFWPTSTAMDNSAENLRMQDCEQYKDATCCTKYWLSPRIEDRFLDASGSCVRRIRDGVCALCSANQANFVRLADGSNHALRFPFA